MADTDPDRSDYLARFAATTHSKPSQNIQPKRFWFAVRQDGNFSLGFGDKEVSVFADRFMVQWIVQALNTRIIEDESKNPNVMTAGSTR